MSADTSRNNRGNVKRKEVLMGLRRVLFYRIINDLLSKTRRSLALRKYDNFTIAEYFRKQGAQIGKGCYIVPRVLGTEPYLVKIGNNVCISIGVHLHTHDGGTWIFRRELPDLRVYGPIIIEDNCLIGDSAHILPNVTIGRNSIVGAGSVVISDVPPDSIVMGIPARRLGSIEKYREKCIERWRVQRPPSFVGDSVEHYDAANNRKEILKELREHLEKIFEKALSKNKDLS